jgi:hypothetical protein
MKETKEAVLGFIVLAKILAESFKDGVQVADAAVILAKLQDPAVMQKIKDAYEQIELVKSEAEDITLNGAFDLLIAILPELKELVVAIKK